MHLLAEETDARVYEMRVLDGRRFVVRLQIALDCWELLAIHDRAIPRRAPPRTVPAAALVVLLLVALSAKVVHLAKRAFRSRGSAHDLPSGGAPA